MTDVAPRWVVDIPRAWSARTGPHGTVVSPRPERPRGVHAHVFIGCERLPIVLDLAHATHLSAGALSSIADEIELLGSSTHHEATFERCTAALSLRPRRTGVDVAQLIVLVASTTEDGESRDAVQLVATCALDDLRTYGPVFADIVASVRPFAQRHAGAARR